MSKSRQLRWDADGGDQKREREKRSDEEKNMVIITVAAINTKKPTQCGQQLDMVVRKMI